MTDVTSRGYPKNFRNLNGRNVYGVFDRHSEDFHVQSRA
jgi:hypothetical protein